MNDLLISIEDVRNIGQLSVHCDKEKIKLAILQAQDNDLKKILCDFWYVILDNWENETYAILINGGYYVAKNGIKREIKGLKDVLAYYAYARYIVLNEYNDTPVGNFDYSSNFTISKSTNSIKAFYEYNINLAKSIYKDIEVYLCSSKDLFPDFKSDNCLPCQQDSDCDKSNPLPYGFKGKNITLNTKKDDRNKFNFRY